MKEAFDTISEDLIGKEITLVGQAVDCKARACLKLKNNVVIYLQNLDSWDSEFSGKVVSVTGILRWEKIIPDPVVDENGAISTGAEGDQLILESAKWELRK